MLNVLLIIEIRKHKNIISNATITAEKMSRKLNPEVLRVVTRQSREAGMLSEEVYN